MEKIRLAYQVLKCYKALRIVHERTCPELDFPSSKAYFTAYEEVYKDSFSTNKRWIRRKTHEFFREIRPIVAKIIEKHRQESVRGIMKRFKRLVSTHKAELSSYYFDLLSHILEDLHRKKRLKLDLEAYLETSLLEQEEARRLNLDPKEYHESLFQ